MNLKIDYTNILAQNVGNGGVSQAEFATFDALGANALKTINGGAKMQGWLQLPFQNAEILARIKACAARVRKSFDNFVLLGIGGSALGPIAAFNALCSPFHNELPKQKRNGAPKFYCLDNVDPERVCALLEILDINKTVFNVVTKSGATSETMSQLLIALSLIKNKLGESKLREHIIATTSENSGNLIKIAKEYNLETFFIPDGVGGRFSQLSPVGLLPAAVLGIDIDEMLRGARDISELCNLPRVAQNPALLCALVHYYSMKKGQNISVMMPYSDALKYFADFYAQLWGESLGKSKNLRGETVYSGQTPVKAVGATDQHSQLQLYAEGPFDKIITFIEVESFRQNIEIPGGLENYPDVAFLSGHSLQKLLQSELQATKFALTKARRPNYSIILPQINAYYIGQLFQFMMHTTAFAGALLGINTYDQPGVEEGKNITYALLGRAGYESVRAELEKAQKTTITMQTPSNKEQE